MATVKATFRITGLPPGILMNNPASMLTGGKGGVKTKVIPKPEEEAASKVYRLDNGQLYADADKFRASIIGTGGGASGRKVGKFSAISRFSAGLLLIQDKLICPLYYPKTHKPIKKYEIDIRTVVIGKARIVRARPYIKEWACDVTFQIDEDFVTVDMVLEILNISGKVAGVYDYRINKKGLFGQYKAELLGSKVLDEK